MIRTRRIALAGAGLLGLAALAGCLEVPLSDGMIFVPPSEAVENGGRGFRNQDWLAPRLFGPNAEAPTIRHGHTETSAHGIAWSEVSISGEDRPLIVYCFGNGSDRYVYGAGAADRLLPFGDVFLFDYPGYGDSGGRTDAAALGEALPELMAELRTRHEGRPIVYWGHSLGGQVCARAAADDPDAAGYVGEATGPNLDRMAEVIRGRVLGPFFRVRPNRGQDWLDAGAALSETDIPVLILDAGRDRVIPGELGRELQAELEEAGRRRVTYELFPAESHSGIDHDPRFRAVAQDWFSSL